MPDPRRKIIKNTTNRRCTNCGGIHDYLSKLSQDVRNDCSVPVAFSSEKAERVAIAYGLGVDAVVDIPDETLVIMDDSARRLPRTSPVVLAQGTVIEDVMPPAGMSSR